MIRYRLYVGTGEARLLASQVSRHFAGATVIPVIGVWQGRLEESTIVEIILKRREPARVERLAEELRGVFQQDSVLLTLEEIQAGGEAARTVAV